jgi:hypothetical protein
LRAQQGVSKPLPTSVSRLATFDDVCAYVARRFVEVFARFA